MTMKSAAEAAKWKPPLVSSSGPPGPWGTPSRMIIVVAVSSIVFSFVRFA